MNELIKSNDVHGAIDNFDEHIKKIHRHKKKVSNEK